MRWRRSLKRLEQYLDSDLYFFQRQALWQEIDRPLGDGGTPFFIQLLDKVIFGRFNVGGTLLIAAQLLGEHCNGGLMHAWNGAMTE